MNIKTKYMTALLGYIFLILPLTSVHAQRYDSSPLINELMYRYEINRMLNGKNRKEITVDQQLNLCLAEIETSRKTWAKNLKTNGQALQKQGFIDKKFTLEEIQSMPNKHPHLVSALRGQNQLVKKSSYSHAAIFAHNKPGCENFFDEEVQIKEIQNRPCRQVKIKLKENSDIYYYQTFCADDTSVYINFAPENETVIDPTETIGTDCIHCQ